MTTRTISTKKNMKILSQQLWKGNQQPKFVNWEAPRNLLISQACSRSGTEVLTWSLLLKNLYNFQNIYRFPKLVGLRSFSPHFLHILAFGPPLFTPEDFPPLCVVSYPACRPRGFSRLTLVATGTRVFCTSVLAPCKILRKFFCTTKIFSHL